VKQTGKFTGAPHSYGRILTGWIITSDECQFDAFAECQ
jgi:hypothetical protein